LSLTRKNRQVIVLKTKQAARASDTARPQEHMRGFVSRELSNGAVSETEEESSSYEDGTGSHRSLYYSVSRELSNSAISETEKESLLPGWHRLPYLFTTSIICSATIYSPLLPMLHGAGCWMRWRCTNGAISRHSTARAGLSWTLERSEAKIIWSIGPINSISLSSLSLSLTLSLWSQDSKTQR